MESPSPRTVSTEPSTVDDVDTLAEDTPQPSATPTWEPRLYLEGARYEGLISKKKDDEPECESFLPIVSDVILIANVQCKWV